MNALETCRSRNLAAFACRSTICSATRCDTWASACPQRGCFFQNGEKLVLAAHFLQTIYTLSLQILSYIKGRKSSEEMTACSNRSGLFPSDSCIVRGHYVLNLSLTTQIQIQTWKEQGLTKLKMIKIMGDRQNTSKTAVAHLCSLHCFGHSDNV